MAMDRAMDRKENGMAADQEISLFADRFSAWYGNGHVILACHAAFPVSITVDLLHQLWANFRNYTDSRGQAQTIPMLAISDLLLSTLFRRTGKDTYEMHADIRARLLSRLQKDPRFGEPRLKALAGFLYQYAAQLPDRPEWQHFKNAQKWMAMLVMDPGSATRDILQALIDQVSDSRVSAGIGITNLIESFTHHSEAFTKNLSTSLRPAGEVTDKPSFNLPAYISDRLQVFAPAAPAATVPGESQGKVYGLIIGVSSEAQAFADAIQSYCKAPVENFIYLKRERATKQSIYAQLHNLFALAGPEDTVIIYYAGPAVNTRERSALSLFSHNDGPDTDTLTDTEFREWIIRLAVQDPTVVLVLDTDAGSRNWLDERNPKHYALMASHLEEKERGMIRISFTNYLTQALRTAPAGFTYRQFYRHSDHKPGPPTPLFAIDSWAWDNRVFTNSAASHLSEERQLLKELGYLSATDEQDVDRIVRARVRFMADHSFHDPKKALHYLDLKKNIQASGKINIMVVSLGILDDINRQFGAPAFNTTHLHPADAYRAFRVNGSESDLENTDVLILAWQRGIDDNSVVTYMECLLDLAIAYQKTIFIYIPVENGIEFLSPSYDSISWEAPPSTNGESALTAFRDFLLHLLTFNLQTPVSQTDIAARIEEARSSNKLDLSQLDLSDIPKEIFDLANLEELYLEGNNITDIPHELTRLSRLKILNCNGNPIRDLPYNLKSLTSLEVLALDNTELEEIHHNISDLVNLRELRIHGTRIVMLPESLTWLDNLEVLDARKCRILNIPRKILNHANAPVRLRKYVKDLTKEHPPENVLLLISQYPANTLNLTRQIGARTEKNNVNNWIRIEGVMNAPTLYAALRQSTAVPCLIYLYDKGGKLFEQFGSDEPGSRLRDLIKFFGAVQIPSMNIFYEGSILSKEFCEDLVKVPRINSVVARTAKGKAETFTTRFFDELLSGAPIEASLGKVISPYSFFRSELYNSFKLPAEMTKPMIPHPKDLTLTGLQHAMENGTLNLSGLRLSEIPPAVFQLKDLQNLDISQNSLTSLPEEIGQLTGLRKLSCDHNRITSLPEALFSLTSLEELSFNVNPLQWIPSQIGQLINLRKLSFAFSAVHSLPVELAALPKLTEIDASINKLLNVPEDVLAEKKAADLRVYLAPPPTTSDEAVLISIGDVNDMTAFLKINAPKKKAAQQYKLVTESMPELDLRRARDVIRPVANRSTLIILDDQDGTGSRQFSVDPARSHNMRQYFESFGHPLNIIYAGKLDMDDAIYDLVRSGHVNSFLVQREQRTESLPALLLELMLRCGQTYLKALQYVKMCFDNSRPPTKGPRFHAFGYDAYYAANRFADFSLVNKKSLSSPPLPIEIVAKPPYGFDPANG